MGSDAIMITPEVEIIKDENGDLLPESVVVSVMTCAAPMIKRGMEGLSDQQYSCENGSFKVAGRKSAW